MEHKRTYLDALTKGQENQKNASSSSDNNVKTTKFAPVSAYPAAKQSPSKSGSSPKAGKNGSASSSSVSPTRARSLSGKPKALTSKSTTSPAAKISLTVSETVIDSTTATHNPSTPLATSIATSSGAGVNDAPKDAVPLPNSLDSLSWSEVPSSSEEYESAASFSSYMNNAIPSAPPARTTKSPHIISQRGRRGYV